MTQKMYTTYCRVAYSKWKSAQALECALLVADDEGVLRMIHVVLGVANVHVDTGMYKIRRYIH